MRTLDGSSSDALYMQLLPVIGGNYSKLSFSLEKAAMIPTVTCLSHCSSAVKKHHDCGNSCKRKCLIGAGLQLQKFSLVHYHHGSMQTGRC